MKPSSMCHPLLLLVLLAATPAAFAAQQTHVRVHCATTNGECPPPPPPPAPPAPPALPAPPAPPAPAAPPVPAMPPLPPQPKIPVVPAAANATCASRQPGTRLAWALSDGERMEGVCVRRHGKMVFELRRYERDR